MTLTNKELEHIKYKIWEPMRRKPGYRNGFSKLKINLSAITDLQAVNDFCSKWKIPYPLNPDLPFEGIYGPIKTMAPIERRKVWGLFYEHYNPPSQQAAFVLPTRWIVDEKYLSLWIDLSCTRNLADSAIKRELDHWHRDQWRKFYNGKRYRKIEGVSVIVGDTRDSYLELRINLEAPRRLIEKELGAILKVNFSQWKGEKKKTLRIHPKKEDTRLKVYDSAERQWPLKQLIFREGLPRKIDTIRSQARQAWKTIRPGEKRPTQKYKKQDSISRIPSLSKSKDCPYCFGFHSIYLVESLNAHICRNCGKEQETGLPVRAYIKKQNPVLS